MEYMGSYTWSNGKGKTCHIEDGRFYGYNGERAEYTPAYAKNLVTAVVASDDENALDILNAIKAAIPFRNASYNSAFCEALREAIDSITFERTYYDSAWERIIKVLRTTPRYRHGSEQTMAMNYKYTIDQMLEVADETDIIQFINQVVAKNDENANTCFHIANLEEFLKLQLIRPYFPGGELPDMSQDAYSTLSALLRNYPQYAQSIAPLLRNGMLQTCYELNVSTIVSTFFKYAKLNDVESPNVNGNLIHKAYLLKKEWEAKQDAMFKSMVEQLRDKLEYRAYGLHVTLPTCEADFIREGEQQHNCVGRYGYYDRMSEGKTIVVFIRKDSEPDKSYITCEISPENGIIGQFFKAYNRSAWNDEQSPQFRIEYEDFLTRQFGN